MDALFKKIYTLHSYLSRLVQVVTGKHIRGDYTISSSLDEDLVY